MKKTMKLLFLCVLLVCFSAPCANSSEGGNGASSDVTLSSKTAKHIGLVAHDALKGEMLAWVRENADQLARHRLICTGTTGRLIGEMFEADFPALSPDITAMKSGPLGGDMQIGAMIADGGVDILVFFVDPMSAQPHDADIRALLRVANLYNIGLATNRATADLIIRSPLF